MGRGTIKVKSVLKAFFRVLENEGGTFARENKFHELFLGGLNFMSLGKTGFGNDEIIFFLMYPPYN